MKKVILSAALLSCVALTANAQNYDVVGNPGPISTNTDVNVVLPDWISMDDNPENMTTANTNDPINWNNTDNGWAIGNMIIGASGTRNYQITVTAEHMTRIGGGSNANVGNAAYMAIPDHNSFAAGELSLASVAGAQLGSTVVPPNQGSFVYEDRAGGLGIAPVAHIPYDGSTPAVMVSTNAGNHNRLYHIGISAFQNSAQGQYYYYNLTGGEYTTTLHFVASLKP